MIPKIKKAFRGWEVKITFIKVVQTISDHQAVEVETPIQFKGIIQPLEADKLKIKPEGQRDWEWWQIHIRTKISLKNGDRVKYNNLYYKVMDIKPYSVNGYYEYHITEDYNE